MKKIFSIFAAALMSASMFAALTPAPDDAKLNGYKGEGDNLVYAIYVEDSIKCNDIVLVGTYNGWTADAAACSTFVAVEGFAGWYVCCVADASESIEAKPAQLDGTGTFNWDYQVGKLEQTAVVRGTATIEPGYSNECNIKAISAAAPLLINVSSWKTNPCTAIFHNYEITIVSPDCNEEEYVTPAISGGFNSWAQDSLAFDAAATYTRIQDQLPGGVFTITVKAAEGTDYKFRSAASWGADWSNELREYDSEAGDWKAFNDGANFTFGTTTQLVYDLGDPTKYSWTSCERPVECDSMEYTITAILPACEASAPNVIGSFCGWSGGVAMTLVEGNTYTATVRALCTDQFKFNDAVLGWDNEIQVKDGEGWKGTDNITFGTEAAISVDYSSADYRWIACAEPEPLSVDTLDNAKAVLAGEDISLKDGVISWYDNNPPASNTATWTVNLEAGEYKVVVAENNTGSGHKFIVAVSFGGTEVGSVAEPADSWEGGDIELEGTFVAAQTGEYTVVLSNGTEWSAAGAKYVIFKRYEITALEQIAAKATAAKKVMIDGKMYIVVNGAIFNVMGAAVK